MEEQGFSLTTPNSESGQVIKSRLTGQVEVTTIPPYTNEQGITDMSYSERLAAQLNNTESRETFNAVKKPAYDWAREANQKRAIR